MKCVHGLDHAVVQLCRRIALVTATVQTNARMLADKADIIPGIVKEHLIVIRIRAIGRIGKPEVLPYHDSVLVTGIIELLVTSLADPVTDHIQIHVPMHTCSGVIFISTVAEVIFTKTPVAALREEAAAVDKHLKVAHHIAVGEFPDASLPIY